MEAAVVIPWRGGDSHREAALRWVRDRYERDGWPVTLGAAPEGPWRKAIALASGIARTNTETLIVADADVWCDGLAEAVDNVHDTGWAIPHRRVRRLTREATVGLLAGGPLTGELEQHHYIGWEGGGVVVIRRDLWQAVPMDPRFQGWGQEDDSWALALRTLAGKAWRGREPLWHLWHPPQPRKSRHTGSEANLALRERYGQAAREPAAMRALIGEVQRELAIPARP